MRALRCGPQPRRRPRDACPALIRGGCSTVPCPALNRGGCAAHCARASRRLLLLLSYRTLMTLAAGAGGCDAPCAGPCNHRRRLFCSNIGLACELASAEASAMHDRQPAASTTQASDVRHDKAACGAGCRPCGWPRCLRRTPRPCHTAPSISFASLAACAHTHPLPLSPLAHCHASPAGPGEAAGVAARPPAVRHGRPPAFTTPFFAAARHARACIAPPLCDSSAVLRTLRGCSVSRHAGVDSPECMCSRWRRNGW